MSAARPPIRVEVDGEMFVVRTTPDRPGHYDFDWVTGPNPGYGFTSAVSDGYEMSVGDFEAAIRDFLANVDPETGFME